MKLNKTTLTQLARSVLAQASVGDLRVSIDASHVGNSRFAASRPTTDGDAQRVWISVRASDGARTATAKGNATDAASIAALVRQAESLAALSPDNPEHVPPLGATKYEKVTRLDPAAAKMGAVERAAAVRAAIEASVKAGAEVSGFIEHATRASVVADRSGLLGYQEGTSVSMTTTCRTTSGGSARRGFVSHKAGGLDAGAMAAEAAQWALRSEHSTAMDPGKYTVVLAPAAVADLLDFFIGALDARAASEGRSVLSKPGGGTKIGEAMFAAAVDLWSDPTHPQHPAPAIADDGRPQVRTEWVAGGRLLALTAGRYWAGREGVPSRPSPSSIHMAGGKGDIDALVGQVERGVLVSRFWYNRMLDRRSLTVTGLTRDGTFLIEKGKVARPVNNFRYNDSPITMLSRLAGSAAAVRTAGDRVTVVPPVIVDGFNFESTTDAI